MGVSNERHPNIDQNNIHVSKVDYLSGIASRRSKTASLTARTPQPSSPRPASPSPISFSAPVKHVGLTRARKRAKIYFATNRRIHGLWSTTVPSRFLDELPEADVEVKEAPGGTGGFGLSGYGPSRFDQAGAFGSSYSTPGWQRAQTRKGTRKDNSGFSDNGQPRYVPDGVFDHADEEDEPASAKSFGGQARHNSFSPPPGGGRSAREARREGVKRPPLLIEGQIVAKSTNAASRFAVGERVFHQKFGNGNVTAVDGNKLTIAFDKAGEKRVVDSFVERV